MRILLIRHGDPDYENDTLTEKGHREARLLAQIAETLHVGDCCVSPLGRARATAEYTLNQLGITARQLDWLREFPAKVRIAPGSELRLAYDETRDIREEVVRGYLWDMLPSYLEQDPVLRSGDWKTAEFVKHSDILAVYDRVTAGFDRLLEQYGYVRRGDGYRVETGKEATVTLFCHFGLICVILSYLWNVSPFVLWHGLALAPTSVSEIVSEEREKGIVQFRVLRLGDVSHLLRAGEPPSFACRFCETFENKEQRH